jgi:hypothetical protein
MLMPMRKTLGTRIADMRMKTTRPKALSILLLAGHHYRYGCLHGVRVIDNSLIYQFY